MSDIRARWIETMQRYRLSPGQPDNEQFWCTQLDTAPQEELRAIQSEKLRVAVRYTYECIPFYRRKFDARRHRAAPWLTCYPIRPSFPMRWSLPVKRFSAILAVHSLSICSPSPADPLVRVSR